MTARIALILSAALLMTACDDEPAAQEPVDDNADRGAVGEVLGGTISDEMIPYEDIRSQAPTAGDDGDGEENGEEGAESE